MQLRNVKVFVLIQSENDLKALQNFFWGAFSEIMSAGFSISIDAAYSYDQAKKILNEKGMDAYDLHVFDGDQLGGSDDLFNWIRILSPNAVSALYSDDNSLVAPAVKSGAKTVLSPSLVRETYGTAVMLFNCMP